MERSDSRRRLALVAVVAALAVSVAAPGTAAPPTLVGTVGPGFTISLKLNGKKATKLEAGKYKLVVRDRSGEHNFAIDGRGIDRAITAVPFIGTKTVTITLRQGRYKFYCEPHEDFMRTRVTVS